MSVKVMTKVWEWSRAEGNDLLVMLALADFCDDDSLCYPGVARVAKKCRISERTVQRTFLKLEGIGELRRVPGAGLKVAGPRGDGFTNAYQIILKGCQIVTPIAEGGDKTVRKGVTKTAEGGDRAVSPKPSANHQEPSGASLFPLPPKPKKQKIGTVNGHKPSQTEIEEFCVKEGLPRLDGELMLLKWNADGWPKNWMDKIRYWKRAGFMPSQKNGARGQKPAQTGDPAGWKEFLDQNPELKSELNRSTMGTVYRFAPERIRLAYMRSRKAALV